MAKTHYTFTVKLTGVVEGTDEIGTTRVRETTNVPLDAGLTENEWDAMSEERRSDIIEKVYEQWVLNLIEDHYEPWSVELLSKER